MQAAGATAENIARELAKLPPETAAPPLELDEADEGPAIGLFLAMQTQWKQAGIAGVRTGLDYAAIEPTARLLGVETSPRLFLDLRLMEDEALRVAAEQAAEQARRRP